MTELAVMTENGQITYDNGQEKFVVLPNDSRSVGAEIVGFTTKGRKVDRVQRIDFFTPVTDAPLDDQLQRIFDTINADLSSRVFPKIEWKYTHYEGFYSVAFFVPGEFVEGLSEIQGEIVDYLPSKYIRFPTNKKGDQYNQYLACLD